MPLPADSFWRALSDPSRRALYERLSREGALAVKTLTEGAGISQPAVSRHLALLSEAGLVTHRRDGREVLYAADPAALAPLVDWAQEMTAFWSGRLDGLETLLKRMDQ